MILLGVIIISIVIALLIRDNCFDDVMITLMVMKLYDVMIIKNHFDHDFALLVFKPIPRVSYVVNNYTTKWVACS